MTRYLLVLGPVLALGVIAIWRVRRQSDDCVSPAWRVDAERRSWGVGLDQPNWKWPVKKRINDAAEFNTAKLRKRA